MSNALAPEPVLRAALRVLHVAACTTRNWTLGEEVVPRQQINALWEAIHEIPDLIKRWRGEEESLRELRMYLREYDQSWSFPRLEQIFDEALNDPSLRIIGLLGAGAAGLRPAVYGVPDAGRSAVTPRARHEPELPTSHQQKDLVRHQHPLVHRRVVPSRRQRRRRTRVGYLAGVPCARLLLFGRRDVDGAGDLHAGICGAGIIGRLAFAVPRMRGPVLFSSRQ